MPHSVAISIHSASNRFSFQNETFKPKSYDFECCSYGSLDDPMLSVSPMPGLESHYHQASEPSSHNLSLAQPELFELDESTTLLLEEADQGLDVYDPQLVEEGEGGTYFIRNTEGDVVGVFKPADEDPQGENNPKKKNLRSAEEPIRRSIPSHETAAREVAAFLLDRGFAGVPPTVMVEVCHQAFNSDTFLEDEVEAPKIGSFQEYVPHECASWDVGPAAFSVEDVHRIGIFDIRSLNTDRHGGNLLCVPKNRPQGKVLYDLVPIDHGYCFPTTLGEANWEWLYWPQAKVAFSEQTLRRIESIDVDADANLLRSLGLSEDAVRVNKITTLLLKKGAAAGLTLFEMARLCCRRTFEEPSPLELIVAATTKDLAREEDSSNNSNNNNEQKDFMRFLGIALDLLLAKPSATKARTMTR